MKRPLTHLILLILFNSAIAGLLTVIGFGPGLGVNMVFSQSIGGMINLPLLARLEPGRRRWLAMSLSLPVAVVLGIALAHGLLGMPLRITPVFWQSLAIGMMFAVLGSTVFLLGERVHRLDDEVRLRRLADAEQARRETEAHLKLLQAQIEPHFLFNTLANVASLIDSDPPRARRLLDRLNDWLRVALARARDEQASLGDELALLENWLEIMTERFGPRLVWRIDADTEVRRQTFPPMLLQPLVENAVKHGIEPKVGGGRVDIQATCSAGRLHVEVRDTGTGLEAAPRAGLGTGLDNVRQRLAALYGEAGGLSLRPGPDGGVIAALELPCAP
jgi:signal transduction histidine kinase